MSTDDIRWELAEGVATLTINRPEQRNALTWDAIAALSAHFRRIRSDPDVRVVVVTGAGDRAFCAGADLSGMGQGAGFLELHEARGALADLFEAMWACGRPTIARVFGYALAGGFGLALACDLVVAADDSVFGAPEVDVGLWPYVITVPLTRSMPPKRALDLMMTGRRVDAAEADRMGIVSRVVPRGDLDSEVATLAATLAAKSAAVLRLGRDAFYDTWDQPAGPALSHLHSMLTLHNQLDDASEGLAAFVEKRAPRWRDR